MVGNKKTLCFSHKFFFCQSSLRSCIFLFMPRTSQPWTFLLHGLCMILLKSAWLERVKPYAFTPKNSEFQLIASSCCCFLCQSFDRCCIFLNIPTPTSQPWTFLQTPPQCPTACSDFSTTDKMVTVWCFVDMKIAMMIQMNANINFDTEWEFHQLHKSNWEGGLDDVTSHT